MNQGKRSTAADVEAQVEAHIEQSDGKPRKDDEIESEAAAPERSAEREVSTAEGAANQHSAPEPADSEALAAEDESTDLKVQLEEALAKADDNWNQFLRARAETENVRRRAERDLANAHKFGIEKFAKDLLPVKDSLEMGIAAATEDGADPAKLLEGSELTLKMLATALSKYGIEVVDPKGEKFNPEQHEAMAMQPSQEADANTVLQVIQKGYLINDRVLRPAMVIVAKPDLP